MKSEVVISFTGQRFLQREQYLPDVEHTDEAGKFLQQNPVLREHLKSIVIALKKFYSSFSLFLEDIHNPEDGTTSLSLLVITNDNADEAYKKMSRFKSAWWWNNKICTEGALTINSVALG